MQALGVTALSMYPRSCASARIRLLGHLPGLVNEGVDLRFRPTLSESEYRALMSLEGAGVKTRAAVRSAVRLRRYAAEPADLRLVHRVCTPVPVPGLEPVRRVGLYDFDDALYVGSVSQANRRFGGLKRESQRWARYVSRAQVVVAGNSYLASEAARLAFRVEVVPSCVDTHRQPVRTHADAGPVVVGWIGSASTGTYLGPIVEAVGALRAEGLDLVMRVVGSAVPQAPSWLSAVPWAEDTEATELQGFDIGVMPMPDTPWTRGKCGYKLLQYHAAGVPAVCSPVGVNVDIVGGGRGLTATTPEQWRDAIRRLAGSAVERRERGALARADVERRFSFDVWTPRLAELLRETVSQS